MKSVESQGKTAEQAVEAGLAELGTTRDKVEVEIISQGKGLFKKTTVRITTKPTEGERALEFVKGVLEKFGIQASAELKEEEGRSKIEITGEEVGAVIGHRGDVLDAVQYLAGIKANAGVEDEKNFHRISVDAAGYRLKRQAALEELADRLAAKAVAENRSVSAEPMNPYERRILHTRLQDNDAVTAQSEGEEPNRYLVITPKGVTPGGHKTYPAYGHDGYHGGQGGYGGDRRGGYGDRRDGYGQGGYGQGGGNRNGGYGGRNSGQGGYGSKSGSGGQGGYGDKRGSYGGRGGQGGYGRSGGGYGNRDNRRGGYGGGHGSDNDLPPEKYGDNPDFEAGANYGYESNDNYGGNSNNYGQQRDNYSGGGQNNNGNYGGGQHDNYNGNSQEKPRSSGAKQQFAFRSSNKKPSPYSRLSGFSEQKTTGSGFSDDPKSGGNGFSDDLSNKSSGFSDDALMGKGSFKAKKD